MAERRVPDIRVRPAESRDEHGVWPLAREFATSFTPERAPFATAFAELLARSDSLVVVAEAEDRIIGYLLAHVHPTFLANAPIVWVEEVMVDADARRRGVGGAVMRAAEQWAESRGAAYVSLATRRAGAFYAALGYDESATFFKKPLLSGR